MPFSSLFFLFFFLPATLLVSRLAGHRLRNYVLLPASLLFYAWGGMITLPVLLSIILGNYVFGLLIECQRQGRQRQATLILGIIANLYPLCYYKYTGFLLGSLNTFFPKLHASMHVPDAAHIPVGIYNLSCAVLSC